MRWEELLGRFANQPLFHTSLLGVFPDPRPSILVQLSRWVNKGKLAQIRRGWYLIEKPYRTKEISAAFIANTVVHPSYLSLEWALQYHGLIPEATFQPTSITTQRGVQFQAVDRIFLYHHVSPKIFHGFVAIEISGEKIVVATPEKALWDRIYINAFQNSFSVAWLKGLRLQNIDRLNLENFRRFGALIHKTGFASAIDGTLEFIRKNGRNS